MWNDGWPVLAQSLATSLRLICSGTLRIGPASRSDLTNSPHSLWFLPETDRHSHSRRPLEFVSQNWRIVDACVVPLDSSSSPAAQCGVVLVLKETWVDVGEFDARRGTGVLEKTEHARRDRLCAAIGHSVVDNPMYKPYDVSLLLPLSPGRAVAQLSHFLARANFATHYSYGDLSLTTLHDYGLSLCHPRPVSLDELGYSLAEFGQGHAYALPAWMSGGAGGGVVRVEDDEDEKDAEWSTHMTPANTPGRADEEREAQAETKPAVNRGKHIELACVDLSSDDEDECGGSRPPPVPKPPPRQITFEDGSKITLGDDSELFCVSEREWLNDTVLNMALTRECLAANRLLRETREGPVIPQVQLLSTYEVAKIRGAFDRDILPREDGPGKTAEMATLLRERVFRNKAKTRDEHLKILDRQTEWTLLPVHCDNHWLLVALHNVWGILVPTIEDMPDAYAEQEQDCILSKKELLDMEDDHPWLRANDRGYAQIVFMDSLSSNDLNKEAIVFIHNRIDAMVRRYLRALVRVRNELTGGEAHLYMYRLMQHRCTGELPEQSNTHDCGLFVIAYARAIMAHGSHALRLTRDSYREMWSIELQLSPGQRQQIIDCVATGRSDLVSWLEEASGGRRLVLPLLTQLPAKQMQRVAATPPAKPPSGDVATVVSRGGDADSLTNGVASMAVQ